MKERIRAIMESKKMTQQEFSQFLEMSPASLSSIFTGRTKPTLNVVELIKNKFDNINLDWLMFGKGPMFNQDENSAENIPSDIYDESNPSADDSQRMNSNSTESESIFSNDPRYSITRDSRNSNAPVAENKDFCDMKYLNNIRRKIKEIRVFYDDQTYESFVPKE